MKRKLLIIGGLLLGGLLFGGATGGLVLFAGAAIQEVTLVGLLGGVYGGILAGIFVDNITKDSNIERRQHGENGLLSHEEIERGISEEDRLLLPRYEDSKNDSLLLSGDDNPPSYEETIRTDTRDRIDNTRIERVGNDERTKQDIER